MILGFEQFIFYTFCRLTSSIFNTVFLIRFGGWTPLTLTHFGKQIPSKVLHIFGLIPVLDNFTHFFSYTFRGMTSLKMCEILHFMYHQISWWSHQIIWWRHQSSDDSLEDPYDFFEPSDDVTKKWILRKNSLMTSSNFLMISSTF